MQISFQPIRNSDLPKIMDIYNYYIVNSTATFHTEKISTDELKEIIPVGNAKYKSFLIQFENEICGYCLLTQYKKRQAYDRTAEVTVYLKPEYSKKGIGIIALSHLEKQP